jgi:hypothetical protein
MMKSWRPLALAAAFNLIAGIGVAAAQTVIARNATPGSTVELVLNDTALGTATADPRGDATLPMNLSAAIQKAETDVFVFVDVCESLRRIVVVERGLQPQAPPAGCERREVVGLFFVRRVSSVVVDVGAVNPTVWLRQGAVDLHPPRPSKVWSPAPTGLVLFGGGAIARFRDPLTVFCGNVVDCSGDKSRIAYSVGATYWVTNFLGADVSYLQPAELSFSGSADTYRFNSFLDAHVLTVSGKGGIPIGPARVYGQFGANYHRATFGTTETIDDKTVTVDGVAQTITGGTQSFTLKTAGWGWAWGGGFEVWINPSFGVYAEFGRAQLKGNAIDDTAGENDDRVTPLIVGARVRIGG